MPTDAPHRGPESATEASIPPRPQSCSGLLGGRDNPPETAIDEDAVHTTQPGVSAANVTAAPAGSQSAKHTAVRSPAALFTGGPLTLDVATAFLRADGTPLHLDDDASHTQPNGHHGSTRTAVPLVQRPEQPPRTAPRGGRRPDATHAGSRLHLRGAAQTATGKAKEVSTAPNRSPARSRPLSARRPQTGSSMGNEDTDKGASAGARAALAPSALLAAHSIDPRQWVLAIRKPNTKSKIASSSTTAPSAGTATHAHGENMKGPSASSAQPSPALSIVPALEEQLTLVDLRRLMYGFASEMAVSEEALMDRLEREAQQKRKAAAAEAAAARASPTPGRPRGSTTVTEAMAGAPEREPPGPRDTTTAPQVAPSDAPFLTPADQLNARDRALPKTAEELTSLLMSGGELNKPSTEGGKHALRPTGANGAKELHGSRPLMGGQRESSRGRSPSVPAAVLAAPRTGETPHPTAIAFERVLSEDAFVSLMREVLAANPLHHAAPLGSAPKPLSGNATATPPALKVTDEAIRYLLNKVDYDGHGSVSWKELATFFISQSQHRTHLAQLSVQYSERPVPANPSSALERHQRSITCYTVNAGKKVILTGSMDGTVRAWGIRSLAHRGLVFSCPDGGWIVGVHFGFLGRQVYIVTMDRRVFVLDGNTFEVLRSFHGRAVDDAVDSVVYAHDTTQTVRVGGVTPPTSSRPGATAPDGTHTQLTEEQRFLQQQRYLRKKATESLGGLASLRMGQAGLQEQLNAAAAVMTTSLAYETLDLDNAQVTTRGTGPYTERRVPQDAIVGLVDAVTATCFHYSALDEETLLLGTTGGDALLVVIPAKSAKKVIVPKHVLLHLHDDAVNKLEILEAMDALVSAGEDGKVVMTSLVTGNPLRTFYAPNFPNQHVAVRDFSLNAPLRMLVTVGPERSALVWDFTQTLPVAVLDAHNGPCHCCAIVAPTDGLVGSLANHPNADEGATAASTSSEAAAAPAPHIMTAGTDGSIHVFDVNGFHLTQTIHMGDGRHGCCGGGGGKDGVAGAGTTTAAGAGGGGSQGEKADKSHHRSRSGGATEANHTAHFILPEVERRSVLLFSRYAFRLQMKRQITSTCPARYCGHHSSMLSILYSRSFDMLITVDAEALAMTWHRPNGRNIFAFSLTDFSDSASMNATTLTAVALDGTQRRMLTGFRNGAVAVWNVVNGQAINFVTVGMAEESSAASNTASGHAASGSTNKATGRAMERQRKEEALRPWRQGAAGKPESKNSSPPPGGAAGGEGSGGPLSSASRKVTAIASVIRHGSVFFVFAIHRTVYVVAEDASTFTVATLFVSWTVPEAYGDVRTLLQVSPQLMACGTASGALLFYHVLSGKQEGAALWVKDASAQLAHGVTLTTAVGATAAGHSTRLPSRARDALPHGSAVGNMAGEAMLSASVRAPSGGANSTATTGGNFNTTLVRLRSIGIAAPSSAMPLRSSTGAGALPTVTGWAASVIASSIVHLAALTHIHAHLLLSVHADGTVSLWHTLRRAYLGSVNLTAVLRRAQTNGGDSFGGTYGGTLDSLTSGGDDVDNVAAASRTGGGTAADAEGDAPAIVVDVSVHNNILAFADGHGSVHVCEMGFRAVPVESAAERKVLDMANPAWYLPSLAALEGRQGSPLSASRAASSPVCRVMGDEVPPSPRTAKDPQEESTPVTHRHHEEPGHGQQTLDADRRLYVFERFAQVRVFPTGLTPISNLLVIDPPSSLQARPSQQIVAPTEGDTSEGDKSVERELGDPVIMCCSHDSQYSRLFTIDGLPIGEPGMDPYDVKDRRTFRYLGEPVLTPSELASVEDGAGGSQAEAEMREDEIGSPFSNPSTKDYSTLDDDASPEEPNESYFDYLSDGYHVHQQQQQQFFMASLRRVGPGRSVGGRNPRVSTMMASSAAMNASYGSLPPSPGVASPAVVPSTAATDGNGNGVAAPSPDDKPKETNAKAAGGEAIRNGASERTPQIPAPVTPPTSSSVPLAVPMKQLYNMGVRHLVLARRTRDNGDPQPVDSAVTAGTEVTGGQNSSDATHAGCTDGARHIPISTLMTRNTKDARTYGEVLKPTYAHQIRLERRLRKQQEEGTASHQHTTGVNFGLEFVSHQSDSPTYSSHGSRIGDGGEGWNGSSSSSTSFRESSRSHHLLSSTGRDGRSRHLFEGSHSTNEHRALRSGRDSTTTAVTNGDERAGQAAPRDEGVCSSSSIIRSGDSAEKNSATEGSFLQRAEQTAERQQRNHITAPSIGSKRPSTSLYREPSHAVSSDALRESTPVLPALIPRSPLQAATERGAAAQPEVRRDGTESREGSSAGFPRADVAAEVHSEGSPMTASVSRPSTTNLSTPSCTTVGSNMTSSENLELNATSVPNELPPLSRGSSTYNPSSILQITAATMTGFPSAASSKVMASPSFPLGEPHATKQPLMVHVAPSTQRRSEARVPKSTTHLRRPQYRSTVMANPPKTTSRGQRRTTRAPLGAAHPAPHHLWRSNAVQLQAPRVAGPNSSRRQSLLSMYSGKTAASGSASPAPALSPKMVAVSDTTLTSARFVETPKQRIPQVPVVLSPRSPTLSAAGPRTPRGRERQRDTHIPPPEVAETEEEMVERMLEEKRVTVLRNLGGADALSPSAASTAEAGVLLAPARPRGNAADKAPPKEPFADSTGPANPGAGSTAIANTSTSAHSFIAAVSARMYVAPVVELEPPQGSRSREEAMAWREHLKRLQEGTSASGRNPNNRYGKR